VFSWFIFRKQGVGIQITIQSAPIAAVLLSERGQTHEVVSRGRRTSMLCVHERIGRKRRLHGATGRNAWPAGGADSVANFPTMHRKPSLFSPRVTPPSEPAAEERQDGEKRGRRRRGIFATPTKDPAIPPKPRSAAIKAMTRHVIANCKHGQALLQKRVGTVGELPAGP